MGVKAEGGVNISAGGVHSGRESTVHYALCSVVRCPLHYALCTVVGVHSALCTVHCALW